MKTRLLPGLLIAGMLLAGGGSVIALAGGSSSPGSAAKDEYCPPSSPQAGQPQGGPGNDCGNGSPGGGGHPGGPGEKPPCVDRRRFKFQLHHGPRSRIVEVRVYVNGKLKSVRRGRDLRAVTLRSLPQKRFHVRIVTIHSNGSRLVSTRTYRGCTKSTPHTHGHHAH